jgi:hypothetical protein
MFEVMSDIFNVHNAYVGGAQIFQKLRNYHKILGDKTLT